MDILSYLNFIELKFHVFINSVSKKKELNHIFKHEFF